MLQAKGEGASPPCRRRGSQPRRRTLCYTVLCWAVAHHTAICYMIRLRAILCYRILYDAILYHGVRYQTVRSLCYITLWHTVLSCNIPFWNIMCYIVVDYSVLYCGIFCCARLCCTMLYYAIVHSDVNIMSTAICAILCCSYHAKLALVDDILYDTRTFCTRHACIYVCICMWV